MSLQWPSLVGLLVVAAVVAAVLERRRRGLVHDVVRSVRRRWVWGLPLGSIVVILTNAAAYALLQRGLWHYADPLDLPFYSWTYRYPSGLLTSPFTHAGPDHLVGNLTSAVAVLPAVEYVVGHRDAERPLRRALVEFPLALYAIGVVVSALSWGPVIGFSGVLFVMLGFLMVVSPLGAVAAVLLGRIVGVVGSALAEPVELTSASTEFVRPWWANVAVESHALGVLLGVGLGVLYARRRQIAVDGVHTGVAFGVVAVLQSLWAVWMTTEGGFVLYRAGGVALTALGAVVIGGFVAIESRADPLLEQETIPLSRAAALVGVLAPLLAFAAVAVAVNAAGVVDTGPSDGVEVRDYRVTYGENVTNGWMAAVPHLDWTGADSRSDGVIVSSPWRGIWIEEVAADELRHERTASFHIGGITWEQRVEATRRGMETVTGNRTYAVRIAAGDAGTWVRHGEPAWTGATVDGWRVGLEQHRDDRFVVLDGGDVRRRIGLGSDRWRATAGVAARIDGDDRVRVAAPNVTTVVGRVR